MQQTAHLSLSMLLFAYLANQYDLKQVAISGVSPDQEPTPSRLAELKEFVKKTTSK